MFLVVSLNNNEIYILKPDAIVLYLFICLSYLVCIHPYDIFQFVIYLISNHILCHVKQEIKYMYIYHTFNSQIMSNNICSEIKPWTKV